MKKAYRTQYGTPEVLSIKETEIPQPEANELLIRVHATTVNRTDLGVLTGKPFVIQFFTGLRKPRQKTTGTDFAGVVVPTGEKVSGFGVGDRVCVDRFVLERRRLRPPPGEGPADQAQLCEIQ